MISSILPKDVAAFETFSEGLHRPLLFEEERALGRAAPVRRREFAIGRSCAHQALERLGLPNHMTPILIGRAHEPLWPVGIVGSITHCTGYCAAVVARTGHLWAIGIDAETNEQLPTGVLNLVASTMERQWLEASPRLGVNWDRLLFSAKESVYKAWFSVTKTWLNFEDVYVTIEPETRELCAYLDPPYPMIADRAVNRFQGRFLVDRGLILTSISLPKEPDTAERTV
jgi:4'-phosphopantetheinyl transferase EntD